MELSTTRVQSIICSIGGHVNCSNCDCHCHIQYKVAYSPVDRQRELAGLLYEFWYNDISEDDRLTLIWKWHTAKEIPVTIDRVDEIFEASTKATAKDYWSLSEAYADLRFTSN